MATNVEVLVHSTARACAWGSQQMSLVNELLAGPVAIRTVEIPYGTYATRWKGPTRVRRMGKTGVDWRSWYNLKKRLTAAGFVLYNQAIENEPEDYLIIMEHPAMGGL